MKGTPQFVMCGNSDRALRALREAGAPVTAVDVLPDPAIRQELSRDLRLADDPAGLRERRADRRRRHRRGAGRRRRAGARSSRSARRRTTASRAAERAVSRSHAGVAKPDRPDRAGVDQRSLERLARGALEPAVEVRPPLEVRARRSARRARRAASRTDGGRHGAPAPVGQGRAGPSARGRPRRAAGAGPRTSRRSARPCGSTRTRRRRAAARGRPACRAPGRADRT